MVKFKQGDVVDYKGHIAEVKKINVPIPHSTTGEVGALVEWDRKDLAPSQMTIPYGDLLYVGPKKDADVFGSDWVDLILESYESIDTDIQCPICDSKWKETWINKQPLYDCTKCNSTKESIMDKYVGSLSDLNMGGVN
jgi:DNA-directed RNA polymerase subunit RPC12/RpoP